MIKIFFLGILMIQGMVFARGQCYWQQSVDYTMNIDMDVEQNQFEGKQTVLYSNNSPDTLHSVFYHLYFNAFQPGSMMDVRSRTIADPDSRVMDRISKLSNREIGYHKIKSLRQDGENANFLVDGTILEVELAEPILPGHTTELVMEFASQVPKQIRRSGRDNLEGVRYSMSQWYPKVCEYDEQGWHSNPYVGREFHGVWGNFDVTINIDPTYLVAASGILQNSSEIGYGYSDHSVDHSGKDQISWHFIAEDVHDFVWAADPDYVHEKMEADDGTQMHFFYQPGSETRAWKELPSKMAKVFGFVSEKYGKYPYPTYAFIQGGDGGMEYPMATLITGHRSISSLTGVSVHELMHSWYQMALATNESLYAWMDEGFTSYTSSIVMNYLKGEEMLPGKQIENPFILTYNSYAKLAESGLEEPLTTHSDHFNTNYAYSIASYVKGAIFLNQLEYIVGKDHFDIAFKKYFEDWKFKHPKPNDVIRIFEKTSGLELDWYKEYWVNSTKTIDYSIDSVYSEDPNTIAIQLSRQGLMPMPLDVYITYRDESLEVVNIPLRIMRGQKEKDRNLQLTHAEDWPWVEPYYIFTVDGNLGEIKSIEIDASGRLADINRENNIWRPRESN
ncbi:M1 family metallopeptidase [Membranihabitans maritimus]|uniref:M1 family metallopeptidase n=1 Tax=Membranihabitans maritimus TaxID=2904244 RepID=UPI001F37BD29|nr:M1 family metallopeptidase [Membranihabitans maritimus]